MSLISKIFKGDMVVWLVFLFLCIISLVEVYSATSTLAYSSGNTFGPIIRHALFLMAGAFVIVILHNIHYKYTTALGLALLLISFLMLILAPFIGVRLNNAARWISVFGIQFQPSEFAKLALVIFTSFVLSKTQRFQESLDKAFWIVLIVTGIFAALILMENLSTAIMLCIVIYTLMYLGRVSSKKLLSLLLVVVVVATLALLALKFIDEVPGFNRWGTWHNRIFGTELSVMDEGFEINDKNYQSSHAKIAISNGMFLGTLPGNSTQRDFLPQAYSDFIYAIIIEELGWFGMLFVPFLYMILLYRALKISRACVKVYPMLLVMGSTLMVVLQAFINMMVAVGAGPVTGQPMPLVSRGGTSTIITCIYFGIILSVSRYANPEAEKVEELKEKEQSELDEITDIAKEYGV